MIPQIIHQYWDGEPSESYKKYMDSIRSMNPEFQYSLWNKDSVVDSCADHILTQYLKEAKPGVIASDIARVILLDHIGGIYLDSDMVSIRPIPDHILIHDTFACYENEYHYGQTIANGALGSIPNAIFIKKVVSEILQYKIEKICKVLSGHSWKVFGPRLWTKIFFDLYCRDITIYPSWYFIPNHYCNTLEKNNTGYITDHIWKSNYPKPPKEWCEKYILSRKFPEIEDMK